MYKLAFYLILTMVITYLAAFIAPFHIALAIYLLGITITFLYIDVKQLEEE